MPDIYIYIYIYMICILTGFFADDGRRCPKCKSDLIIELDMGQISRSVGQHGMMTFDLQSEGPGGMPYKPALHSTPIKSQNSDRLIAFGCYLCVLLLISCFVVKTSRHSLFIYY